MPSGSYGPVKGPVRELPNQSLTFLCNGVTLEFVQPGALQHIFDPGSLLKDACC